MQLDAIAPRSGCLVVLKQSAKGRNGVAGACPARADQQADYRLPAKRLLVSTLRLRRQRQTNLETRYSKEVDCQEGGRQFAGCQKEHAVVACERLWSGGNLQPSACKPRRRERDELHWERRVAESFGFVRIDRYPLGGRLACGSDLGIRIG